MHQSIQSYVADLARDVTPDIHAHIKQQLEAGSGRPFILALTGLQGSGKSTWANGLVKQFTDVHKLNAVTLSLDDLYHTQKDLTAIREQYPHNGLLQTRGQPGTHDEKLAQQVFASLRNAARAGQPPISLPIFDKSLFAGKGDRLPAEQWVKVAPPVDVVVFEGWCVGFQPLDSADLAAKWEAAKALARDNDYPKSTCTLADHTLADLTFVNDKLASYCETFMGPEHFDALVHLDTEDLRNVYEWRWQQEQALIAARGSGMGEMQVDRFVKGYMPLYELCLDQLRSGFFDPALHRITYRIVFSRSREITSVNKLSGNNVTHFS